MDPNADDNDLSKMDRGDTVPGAVDAPVDEVETTVEEAPAEAPATEEAPAEEAAPKAEAPKADEPPKKPKIQIPKERLDEEVAKRRRLEQELADMKAKLSDVEQRLPPKEAPAPADPVTVVGSREWFDAREEAYMDAVLDGKNKEALEIRRQIREAEEAAFEEKVAKRSKQAVKEVDIEAENARAIDQLEGAFGVFNPQSAEFDDDLVNAVLGARAAIMKRNPGKLPGAALIEAAAKLGYKLGGEPAVVEEAEAEEEEDVVATPPASTVAQPPRSGGESPAKTKPRLTEASIGKMSAQDLARARGDIL